MKAELGASWSGGPEGLEELRTAGRRCPVRFQRRVLPAGAPLNLDVSMAARAATLLLLLLLLWIFTCTVSPGRVGRTSDRPSSVGARTISPDRQLIFCCCLVFFLRLEKCDKVQDRVFSSAFSQLCSLMVGRTSPCCLHGPSSPLDCCVSALSNVWL